MTEKNKESCGLALLAGLCLLFACNPNSEIETPYTSEALQQIKSYPFQMTVAIGYSDANPFTNLNVQGSFYIDEELACHCWFFEDNPMLVTFSKEFIAGEHTFRFELSSISTAKFFSSNISKVCLYYKLDSLAPEIKAVPNIFGELEAERPSLSGEGAVDLNIGQSCIFSFVVEKI